MQTKIIIVTLILLIALTGCGPKIIKHPDAPMLILESKGQVLVAVEIDGQLVEYGWIDVPDGWTLVKYDWKEIK